MTHIARDIGRKLAADIHAACKRNIALVDSYPDKLAVLRIGSASVLAWLAAGICETDDGTMSTPDDGPPAEAIWIAAFLMAQGLTNPNGDVVSNAYADYEEWKRLGRIKANDSEATP